MRLAPGEPEFGPWVATDAADLVRRWSAPPPGRPLVIAVDGRSGGGKSTAAAVLAVAANPLTGPVAVVHTDDVAWHHSFFDWAELLRAGVLEPVRAGRPVAYRPPAWDERGRPGAIEVGPDVGLVLVEGVGAGRRELTDLVDGLIWVQSDLDVARSRGLARDGGDAAAAFWDEWMAAEVPFQAAQRPWARADHIVLGTCARSAGPGRLWVAEPGDWRGSSPA